jgi:alpha-amylase/alpha-mannosidase (GH57 family)
MERYVCVHGHFYQPPRENPWLEAVEFQVSASPYHDWNERITAECYGPNSASRILDSEGYISRIINNYSRMSFNFGPTLLSWLEQNSPAVYGAIQAADRESAERYSGHGSAIAQVYNHMILPLANQRDKETQIKWGIRDFEYRFARKPEGMWLAETAADVGTLETLAENGIAFTILAQGQAHRVRRKAGGAWRDVSGGRIDPTRAYECRLPSGKSISIFFYDGPISQAVAFEGLLESGVRFADRLLTGFSDKRNWPQLMHIATDGETYGHHHKFGDMALCYALNHIEETGAAKLTNYGEYLEKHPPSHVVEIFDNTSWSCAHGVERWRSNCGCSTGGRAGWNQEWRGPLRESLDWLRDKLAGLFEREAAACFRDPWEARDSYITVLLDRSPASIEEFFSENQSSVLSPEQRQRAIKLMELQRHCLLMYTSCGWFFDELSGIETVQVIQYAARSIQLSREISNENVEDEFVARLSGARSNIAEFGDGRQIYENFVKPGMIDLKKVAAHYAMSSLFMPPNEQGRIYSYTLDQEVRRVYETGHSRLLVGHATFCSEITFDKQHIEFIVLHFGDQNLTGGVQDFRSDEEFEKLASDFSALFQRGEITEVLRLLDQQMPDATFTLTSLFKDQQRQVLDSILGNTLTQTAANLRVTFDSHAPLINYLNGLKIPLPPVLRSIARFAISSDLRRSMEADYPDVNHISAILRDAKAWKTELDLEDFPYTIDQMMQRRSQYWLEAPLDMERISAFASFAKAASLLPVAVSFWHAQNACAEVGQTIYPEVLRRRESGETEVQEWITKFDELSGLLRLRIQK